MGNKERRRFVWERDKALALLRVRDAIRSSEIDPDIADVVLLINRFEKWYTTSSCSGRIFLIEMPEVFTKKNARILGKWHWKVGVEEVKRVIEGFKGRNLILSVRGPIIHVIARDIWSAKEFLSLAYQAGFNKSGIRYINPERVFIEVRGSEYTDVPVILDGKRTLNESALPTVVKTLNQLLVRSKVKLKRLKDVLLRYKLA